MKHDIIKTDNYLLIVDDSEIKVGDWVMEYQPNDSEGELHFINGEYVLAKDIQKKVISHLPLNNSPILESVLLLSPLEDDVEKLSADYTEEWCGKRKVDVYIHDAFKGGYNKAKEKYKYTEENVRKAIEMAREQYLVKYTDDDYDFEYKEDEIIQSLQQPKYPIGFECEMENKIAIDGHTVIGSEPKTTTNSQGQTVLEGKYIYE